MAVSEEEEKEDGEVVEVWRVISISEEENVFLHVREQENDGTRMQVASIQSLALGTDSDSNAATSSISSALVSQDKNWYLFDTSMLYDVLDETAAFELSYQAFRYQSRLNNNCWSPDLFK